MQVHLEKLKNKSIKISQARLELEHQKYLITQKELKLSEDRKEILRLKKENEDELNSLRLIQSKLNQDYALLKHEKILQKAKKSLLKSIEKRISSKSVQLSRRRDLMTLAHCPHEFSDQVPHSAISLTASVNPISADSDSVAEESPLNTQESIDLLQ
jgi:hypothetical protein